MRAAENGPAPARLLPSGDAYFLLDGAERELLVPRADQRERLWTSRVWPGALLVEGEIRGTWRRAQHTVRIEAWERLSRARRDAVEAEARALPLPSLDQEIDCLGLPEARHLVSSLTCARCRSRAGSSSARLHSCSRWQLWTPCARGRARQRRRGPCQLPSSRPALRNSGSHGSASVSSDLRRGPPWLLRHDAASLRANRLRTGRRAQNRELQATNARVSKVVRRSDR